jgi:exonuclease III
MEETNNDYNFKAWAGVKICSCNVSSLNLSQSNIDDPLSTLNKKLSSILKLNADVFLLQDTRVSNKAHIITKYTTCTKWGNFEIYINSTMNRRGVITLINKKSNIEIIEQRNSGDENCMILKLKKNDSSIILVNVYGPTQAEHPQFLHNLKTELQLFSNLPIILSGDFNCISNSTKPTSVRDTSNKDLIGTINIPNPRNTKIIEKWNREGTFFDVFRIKNPNTTEYSFVSFNVASTQRSRIDLTLANDLALKIIKSVEYIFQPSFFDHKVQIIKLTNNEASAPRADMKNLDSQGINEVVLTTIINTYLDYAVWVPTSRAPLIPAAPEQTELYTPASILEHAATLTGKLELIKAKIRLELTSTDLWLKLIIESDILDFWSFYQQKFDLEFIQNYDKSIDDSLFLQCLVNNLTNEIISFQTSLKKSENRKKDNLYKSLTSLMRTSPINPTVMTEIEQKIKTLEESKIDKICKANKKWETLQNERGSRAFCSLSKQPNGCADFDILMNCDVTPPIPFVNEKEKGLNVNGFYIELFTCVDNKVNLSIEEFLGPNLANCDYVKEKKLTTEDRDRLDEGITIKELRDSVASSNSTSAPGFDGHNYGFIKKYLNYLETPMIKCYKLWILSEQVLNNFGISKVKLIPKKNNLHNIKNWRPISLLSVYYKIFSGIVAQRLKTVSDKITSDCQKAYSSSKNISEVSMDMTNVLKAANFSNTSLAVVSVDFRKAFDSISHKYILNCLRFFNFGEYFIKLTLACIKGKRGFISNLNDSSQTFEIGAGVAQGDRPSGLYFNIVLEPLLILIQKCEILTDSMIRRKAGCMGPERPLSRRLFGYADDLNAIIRATIANIRRLMLILDNFYYTSGLKTNFEKTSVCPVLTDENFENEVHNEGLLIEKTFTLLGVKYDHKGEKIDELNEKKILDSIKSTADLWGKFYLSVPGKISVVKTYFYSQIGYFAPFIKFSDNFHSQVESMITTFINKDRKIGIKKCFLPANVGGLGLFKSKNYVDGIKVSFFRRHFGSNDGWATCIKNSRNMGNELKFFNMKYLYNMFPASADLCDAFERFTRGFYKYPENVDQNPVLENPAVRHQGEPISQRIGSGLNLEDCIKLSNLRIRDLTDINNRVHNLTVFNNIHNTNIPPRVYRTLISSTENIRGKISPESLKGPSLSFLAKSKKKGSKIFRKYLKPPTNLNTIKNLTATSTRQDWYDFNIDPSSEMKLLSLWTNSGFPNDIREGLMLISMNLFKANIHLSKFARDENEQETSPLCSNCAIYEGANAPRENYVHLFVTCPKTIELNTVFNRIKKLDYQLNLDKLFVTNGNNAIDYPHTILLALLIFHLTKLRNITTDRNAKIMNKLKSSVLDFCEIQPKFRHMINTVVVPEFLYE